MAGNRLMQRVASALEESLQDVARYLASSTRQLAASVQPNEHSAASSFDQIKSFGLQTQFITRALMPRRNDTNSTTGNIRLPFQ